MRDNKFKILNNDGNTRKIMTHTVVMNKVSIK